MSETKLRDLLSDIHHNDHGWDKVWAYAQVFFWLVVATLVNYVWPPVLVGIVLFGAQKLELIHFGLGPAICN